LFFFVVLFFIVFFLFFCLICGDTTIACHVASGEFYFLPDLITFDHLTCPPLRSPHPYRPPLTQVGILRPNKILFTSLEIVSYAPRRLLMRCMTCNEVVIIL
jgi:hypothetical protein